MGALLAIGVAVWRFNPHTPYPGYYTLVPVLATAALIGAGGTFLHRRLLSLPPVVFVGLISYPLYLWHFPLMAYARSHYVEGVTPQTMAAIVLASGILAFATYRFIERPIRFGKALVPLKVVALAGSMALLGAVGVLADRTKGLPIRIPDSIRPFMLTGEETSAHWRRGTCLLLPEQSAADFAAECAGDGRRPLLLIWGDSYGAAFYPGLDHFAGERGYGVAEFTASACPPLIGYVRPERAFCKSINDYVLQRIAQLRPEVVIFDSTWSYSAEVLHDGLEETVRLLKALDIKKIVLMGPVPGWYGEGLAANVLDYYFASGSHALLPERTFYRSADNWTRALESYLDVQARAAGIDYISTRGILCNDDGCLARIGPNGSDLTAYDGGHLTVPGSIFLAGRVLDRLLDVTQ